MRKGCHPVVGNLTDNRNVSIQIHLTDVRVLNIINKIAMRIQTDAGLTESLVEYAVEIDISLQISLLVASQLPFFARFQVFKEHIRVSVTVADEVEPFVVVAQGGAREIQQLGVIMLLELTTAY